MDYGGAFGGATPTQDEGFQGGGGGTPTQDEDFLSVGMDTNQVHTINMFDAAGLAGSEQAYFQDLGSNILEEFSDLPEAPIGSPLGNPMDSTPASPEMSASGGPNEYYSAVDPSGEMGSPMGSPVQNDSAPESPEQMGSPTSPAMEPGLGFAEQDIAGPESPEYDVEARFNTSGPYSPDDGGFNVDAFIGSPEGPRSPDELITPGSQDFVADGPASPDGLHLEGYLPQSPTQDEYFAEPVNGSGPGMYDPESPPPMAFDVNDPASPPQVAYETETPASPLMEDQYNMRPPSPLDDFNSHGPTDIQDFQAVGLTETTVEEYNHEGPSSPVAEEFVTDEPMTAVVEEYIPEGHSSPLAEEYVQNDGPVVEEYHVEQVVDSTSYEEVAENVQEQSAPASPTGSFSPVQFQVGDGSPASPVGSASPGAGSHVSRRSSRGSQSPRSRSGSYQSRSGSRGSRSGSNVSGRSGSRSRSRSHSGSRSRSGSNVSMRSGSPAGSARSGSYRSRRRSPESGRSRSRSRSANSKGSRSRSGSRGSRGSAASRGSRSRSGSPRSVGSGSPPASPRSGPTSPTGSAAGPGSPFRESDAGSDNEEAQHSKAKDDDEASEKGSVVGELIADIFGESDEDEEFEGFGAEDVEAHAKKDKARAAMVSDDEDTENVPAADAGPDAGSSDDENMTQAHRDQGDFVSDFDLMLERKKEEMRKRRRKRKDVDIINDNDDLIAAMIQKMRTCAEEDRELNAARKPAIMKLKMLPKVMTQLLKADLHEAFLELNVLSVMTEWLAPLPDKSLPHLKIRDALLQQMLDFPPIAKDLLKSSGIGKAVMYLYKHPKEVRTNKIKAGKLVNEWSRPIFNLTSNYKTLTREEREQRDYEQLPKKRKLVLEGNQTPQRDIDKALQGDEQALRPGDAGYVIRARVPQPSKKDYVIRPKWAIEDKPSKSTKKSLDRFERHLKDYKDKKARNKQNQKVASISIEGRNMTL